MVRNHCIKFVQLNILLVILLVLRTKFMRVSTILRKIAIEELKINCRLKLLRKKINVGNLI